MAEEFNPFASGRATEVAAEPTFDPFASGRAVAVSSKEESFDPFSSGRAAAIEDTSMIDRIWARLSPERQLPEESLKRVEQARIDAINSAPAPTLLGRVGENIKNAWANSNIGSMLESIGEPLANEPLELRRQRATVDGLAREKARRSGALGDVLSDPSFVEIPDKALDSEIEKHGKKLLAQIEKFAPETAERIKDREESLTSSAKRIGSYQGLPDYQGPVEGLASLSGQIIGSIADPANFIGGPEVKLAKNATRLGRVANKFIGEGLGASVGNLATEPMSQSNRIRTGELEQFSPSDAAKGAALGFVAGGVIGAASTALKKGPSIVTQMDGATNGTPSAANLQANEIAMKPVVPTASLGDVVPGTNPADSAMAKVNKGIVEQSDNVEARSAKDPSIGPAEKELTSKPGGVEHLKSIKDALASDNGYVQIVVWPEEYTLPGKGRGETFDLIDPDNPQPGGNGSTNRALLNELGIEIPEIPKDFPHGTYTLDEFKAELKKRDEIISDTLKAAKEKEAPEAPDANEAKAPPAEASALAAQATAPNPDGPIRNLAKRVIDNEDQPAPIRDALSEEPSIIYDVFERNKLVSRVEGMTPQELEALSASANNNERVAATIELANRASLEGRHAEAATLFAKAAGEFTSPAQILGLAKMVKSPQRVVEAIEEALTNAIGTDKNPDGSVAPKRKLTPEQKKAALDLATEDIKAQKELRDSEKAAEDDFTEANEKALENAKRRAGKSSKDLDNFSSDVIPEKLGDTLGKIIQGVLLTTKSVIASGADNFILGSIRRISSSLASAADAIYSKSTGRSRRIISGNPLPSGLELSEAAKGLKLAANEFFTGPSEESYLKAEVQKGFRPFRSLVQAFTADNLPVKQDGTVAVTDRANKLIQGLLGAEPEIMFRLLNITDKPFRRAEAMNALLEQARLKQVKPGDLRRFMVLPDNATKKVVEDASRAAVYMQENRGGKQLNSFLDTGVSKLLGLDRIPAAAAAVKLFNKMVVPFRQFPVNYVMTALNFASPELAISKAIYYAQAGNRRKALTNMAEASIGISLYAAADYLWDNGIISEPQSKDAKTRSIQFDNMGASRLNVSGLNRLLEGGDPTWKPGDETKEWTKMGIPAAIFYLHTQRESMLSKKESKKGVESSGAKDFADLAASRIGAFPGMASFALDQSFLSGTSAVLEAFKNPDPENGMFQAWAANMFKVAAAIPVPNTIEQVAKANYEFMPELKGDSMWETMGNIWKFRTQQLPKDDSAVLKRDMWGDPMRRTPEGASPVISQFLDITNTSRKANDEFKSRLFKLYSETESPDVYPMTPGRDISFLGITSKMSPEDAEKYQEVVGKARRQYAEDFVLSDGFDSIPSWARVDTLQKIYSEASTAASDEFKGNPEILKKYFPEIVGDPDQKESRVMRRNPKASLRLSELEPTSSP